MYFIRYITHNLSAIKELEVNIIFIVVVIVVLAVILAFALLAYRIYFRKILIEKTSKHEMEIEHQKKLLDEGIKVQEVERERIAKQLHDDVGNKLNVLSVWIGNPKTWNSEESREIIAGQIPALIETTRTISHTLYPANIERFGLDVALEELTSSLSSSLKVELVVIPRYIRNDLALEVQLYRVIQEFMSNVIKHAEASMLSIQLRSTERGLGLILADNGKGFDSSVEAKGMGIRNMESRLNNLEATYKWNNRLKRGSKLIVIIPRT